MRVRRPSFQQRPSAERALAFPIHWPNSALILADLPAPVELIHPEDLARLLADTTIRRNRKVGQWGLAYVAGAWGFPQGLGYLSDTFGWPGQIRQLVTLALLIGGGATMGRTGFLV